METTKTPKLTLSKKPILGISECLMGKEVRFNGGHKRSRYCTDVLSEFFEFKMICPEVGIGMSVPRKAIRMTKDKENVRLIASDNSGSDFSQPMKNFAHDIAPSLRDLSGYIFMQKSPSCAVGSGKIYSETGYPEPGVNGVFSGELISKLPLLPVTEAGRLNDQPIRENFITVVYAYHEWQQTVINCLSAESLLNFHCRYKLLLKAHSPLIARELGVLLSNMTIKPLSVLADQYISGFMKAMNIVVPRKRQVGVLLSFSKYLKKSLNLSEFQELINQIKHYSDGIVPLIVPMTLLKYFVSKYHFDINTAALDPYPISLGLRNSI